MENKSKELTFIDLINIIFKRKILFATITLLITILGTVILGVFYNNSNAYYTTSFTLDYPGIENLTLPDGSNLKYTNFISQSSLEKVKKSNNSYANIDVKALALSDDISISQEIITNSANKKDTVYTITIKAKYFPNKEVAKSFLKDLSTLPIVSVKEMVKNTVHNGYLNAYNSSLSTDNKLAFLEAQKTYLLEAYDTTITSLGNISVNNKSLIAHKQDVENYFAINSLELLISEFEINGYAPKNEALAKSYQLKINALLNKKSSNEAIIEGIRAELGNPAYSNKQFDSTRILEILEENALIEKKIEILGRALSYAKGEKPEEEYTAFEAKLKDFYFNLDKYTNEYTQNINSIYEQLSSITFEKSSIIKEKGGISIPIAGGASFIVGFIISSCVILILNAIKKKKEV